MSRAQLAGLVRHLGRLIGSGRCASCPDSQLLRRFVEEREQAAFSELVQRHGPMVLGVCSHVLRDSHDAEDAFQAAFLVLARKADTIRQGTSLAGWLYRVAFRIALRARSSTAQRKQHETQVTDMATANSAVDDSAGRELQPVHEEIARLPERYRLPVVLCYLQSKTNEEAATELGWPVGTVKTRLNRARAILRGRLERRGLALASALFAVEGGQQALAAPAIPITLADRTVHAALVFATPTTVVAGGASPSAVRLAEGAISAMWTAKMKVAAVVALAASLLTVGGGTFWFQGIEAHEAQTNAPAPLAGQVAAERQSEVDRQPRPGFDLADDPLPPGAVARLGTLHWIQEAPFRFAAYLPNGTDLLTATQDGVFRVWEVKSGKVLRQFGTPRVLTDYWRTELRPTALFLPK